ncbi:endolytic transglycosylase MltG [Filomicrobium sp.]|uniref:endolytic transglycosylase MltG n=1 Tax=Filomicrobium sp. TaxID=2024831 RepID=UPI00259030E1|nr:endolytic transglycosylase MltG [Filomicrobium sp.]MCV0371532.1 endolytic transglycosylase MltG [Filomicrobium sp.]
MSMRRLEPELPSSGRSIRPRSPAEMLEPSRAPERPRGRKHRRGRSSLSGFVRVISGVLTTLLVVMVVLVGAMFLLNHQFESPGPLEVSRTIVIPRGEGRIEIATRLEREGIIANRWTFIINHLVRNVLNGERLDLKAGEFEIEKAASMRAVLSELSEGRAIEYKLTIPEGLTSQQIVERIRADTNLTGEITAIPAEGSLLPDTYAYSRGMDRQALVDRMRAEQRRVLMEAWETRQADLPISSPEEAVILASIIEKETGEPDERDRVAAVFVNRLRKRMRLQSDPTIIYGIVGGQGSLGRPIYRSDIKEKTAYNTYHISGLPPTPICNPGRDAIKAALNPSNSKDLYFVADGTGGHTFSETLQEHNEAVADWRKIEREARAKAKAAAAEKGANSSDSAEASDQADANVAAQAAAAEPGTAAVTLPVAGAVPIPVRKPR